jgi:hypothetical protein
MLACWLAGRLAGWQDLEKMRFYPDKYSDQLASRPASQPAS